MVMDLLHSSKLFKRSQLFGAVDMPIHLEPDLSLKANLPGCSCRVKAMATWVSLH